MKSNQQKLNQSVGLSYHDKIDRILVQWYQLQQEKQQLLEVEKQDQCVRMMKEEDLENQQKEWERREEEQYKRMEQAIEEQLEHETQSESSMDELELDYIEELKLMEELELIEEGKGEEQEKEQKTDAKLKQIETWQHHEQLYHLEPLEENRQHSNKVSIYYWLK